MSTRRVLDRRLLRLLTQREIHLSAVARKVRLLIGYLKLIAPEVDGRQCSCSVEHWGFLLTDQEHFSFSGLNLGLLMSDRARRLTTPLLLQHMDQDQNPWDQTLQAKDHPHPLQMEAAVEAQQHTLQQFLPASLQFQASSSVPQPLQAARPQHKHQAKQDRCQ